MGGAGNYMPESFAEEYGEAVINEISTEPTQSQTNNPVSVPEPTATTSLFTFAALGAVCSLKRKMKRKFNCLDFLDWNAAYFALG